eukprot:g4254.t1
MGSLKEKKVGEDTGWTPTLSNCKLRTALWGEELRSFGEDGQLKYVAGQAVEQTVATFLTNDETINSTVDFLKVKVAKMCEAGISVTDRGYNHLDTFVKTLYWVTSQFHISAQSLQRYQCDSCNEGKYVYGDDVEDSKTATPLPRMACCIGEKGPFYEDNLGLKHENKMCTYSLLLDDKDSSTLKVEPIIDVSYLNDIEHMNVPVDLVSAKVHKKMIQESHLIGDFIEQAIPGTRALEAYDDEVADMEDSEIIVLKDSVQNEEYRKRIGIDRKTFENLLEKRKQQKKDGFSETVSEGLCFYALDSDKNYDFSYCKRALNHEEGGEVDDKNPFPQSPDQTTCAVCEELVQRIYTQRRRRVDFVGYEVEKLFRMIANKKGFVIDSILDCEKWFNSCPSDSNGMDAVQQCLKLTRFLYQPEDKEAYFMSSFLNKNTSSSIKNAIDYYLNDFNDIEGTGDLEGDTALENIRKKNVTLLEQIVAQIVARHHCNMMGCCGASSGYGVDIGSPFAPHSSVVVFSDDVDTMEDNLIDMYTKSQLNAAKKVSELVIESLTIHRELPFVELFNTNQVLVGTETVEPEREHNDGEEESVPPGRMEPSVGPILRRKLLKGEISVQRYKELMSKAKFEVDPMLLDKYPELQVAYDEVKKGRISMDCFQVVAKKTIRASKIKPPSEEAQIIQDARKELSLGRISQQNFDDILLLHDCSDEIMGIDKAFREGAITEEEKEEMERKVKCAREDQVIDDLDEEEDLKCGADNAFPNLGIHSSFPSSEENHEIQILLGFKANPKSFLQEEDQCAARLWEWTPNEEEACGWDEIDDRTDQAEAVSDVEDLRVNGLRGKRLRMPPITTLDDFSLSKESTKAAMLCTSCIEVAKFFLFNAAAHEEADNSSNKGFEEEELEEYRPSNCVACGVFSQEKCSRMPLLPAFASVDGMEASGIGDQTFNAKSQSMPECRIELRDGTRRMGLKNTGIEGMDMDGEIMTEYQKLLNIVNHVPNIPAEQQGRFSSEMTIPSIFLNTPQLVWPSQKCHALTCSRIATVLEQDRILSDASAFLRFDIKGKDLVRVYNRYEAMKILDQDDPNTRICGFESLYEHAAALICSKKACCNLSTMRNGDPLGRNGLAAAAGIEVDDGDDDDGKSKLTLFNHVCGDEHEFKKWKIETSYRWTKRKLIQRYLSLSSSSEEDERKKFKIRKLWEVNEFNYLEMFNYLKPSDFIRGENEEYAKFWDAVKNGKDIYKRCEPDDVHCTQSNIKCPHHPPDDFKVEGHHVSFFPQDSSLVTCSKALDANFLLRKNQRVAFTISNGDLGRYVKYIEDLIKPFITEGVLKSSSCGDGGIADRVKRKSQKVLESAAHIMHVKDSDDSEATIEYSIKTKDESRRMVEKVKTTRRNVKELLISSICGQKNITLTEPQMRRCECLANHYIYPFQKTGCLAWDSRELNKPLGRYTKQELERKMACFDAKK